MTENSSPDSPPEHSNIAREAQPLLIGVDVGTTRTKCLIIDPTGKRVGGANCPTPSGHSRPDWTEYDPEALWLTVCQTIRLAVTPLQHPERIQAIAIASFAESAVPLDEGNKPLDHAIAWFDPRTQEECTALVERIGAERLFKISGLTPASIYGLPKLLWFKRHRPERFAKLRTWLNIADFISFRLSGVAATDYSLACRTMALDLAQRAWDQALLKELGLSSEIFAPLRPSGTPLGKVTAEAAKACGLPGHTLVAVGGHDHIVGAFAAGTLEEGILLDSLGTSESLMLSLDQPLLNSEVLSAGVAQGLICIDRPYYYVLNGMLTSGASMEWFWNTVETDVEQLFKEAEKTEPGTVVFLPHLRGTLVPVADEKVKGSFVGLSPETKRGDLFRAVLEGVALEGRLVFDSVMSVAKGIKLREIRMIGRNTSNRFFMDLKAAVLGRSIGLCTINESTSFGAALLAGLSAKVFSNVQEALAAVPQVEEWIEPDAKQSAFYESLYQQIYRHLYLALSPLQHRLGELKRR